uniref:Uncharacterized protein n=1 Tax=Anguilla anguilla TaxID=7936 RepID=A0A0E9SDJ1_ANGAN
MSLLGSQVATPVWPGSAVSQS